ncbi:GL18272 [Drosophila persimilis]|uniref:GL18272 n=1 Tax=Drosophila persimilis TaxID=7234 RepID=B4H4P5_DROPE|nr:GL18272 [Drosophila persimilis]
MNFAMLLLVFLCYLLPLSVVPETGWKPESSNSMTKSLFDLYGELKQRPRFGEDQKSLKETSDDLMKFQLCADTTGSCEDKEKILVKDEDDEEYEDAAADDNAGYKDDECGINSDKEREEHQKDGTFMERVSCLIRGIHRSFKAMEDDLNDLASQLHEQLAEQNDEESCPENVQSDECPDQEPDKKGNPTDECGQDSNEDEWQNDPQEDEWQTEPNEVPKKIPDMDLLQQIYLLNAHLYEEDDESSEPELDYGTDTDPDADEESELYPRLQLRHYQDNYL